MKQRLIAILLAGVGFLLINGCAAPKAATGQQDTTVHRYHPPEETIDVNRPRANVPGITTFLTFRPDSLKIEKEKADETIFLIYDPIHQCFLMTLHRALWTKVVQWLPEEATPDSKNGILITGSLVDIFSYISRKELDEQTQIVQKILLANDLKIYIITGFQHCPDGPPLGVIEQIKGVGQNLPNPAPNQKVSDPYQPGNTGKRKKYKE